MYYGQYSQVSFSHSIMFPILSHHIPTTSFHNCHNHSPKDVNMMEWAHHYCLCSVSPMELAQTCSSWDHFLKCAINGKMGTFWHLWLSSDGSKAQNTWDRISPQALFS